MTYTEWLEADGTGGFASGTASTVRTRRYHALLLADTPRGRFVLVNGMEAWVTSGGVDTPLGSQRYVPNVIHPPANAARTFEASLWPTWTTPLADGSVTQAVFAAPGSGQVSLRWRRTGGRDAGPATLSVRLLLSGRDYHALHQENPAFDFEPVERGRAAVVWQTYPGLPPVAAHGGHYTHAPLWFRQFSYTAEAARGMDATEDLASPGILTWDLAQGDATLALRADREPGLPIAALAETEAARRRGQSRGQRLAAPFLAVRDGRQTVIAGYPWFTDWGRDTFIALRGLLLTTGQHTRAVAVLRAWAGLVSEGMLPNRFPDGGGAPEYNAVDASLWFVVAVHDLFAAGPVPDADADTLRAACGAILDGYARGTRFGIRMDADGLLASGQPGTQLTWMDAKVGDWVVTPRAGKPVEVQALWINALAIAGSWAPRWRGPEQRARESFLARFADDATGGLVDVVDAGGVAGATDRRVRPNQIFATGGLPFACVPADRARGILAVIEQRLLTPLGLRTLDPADPGYRGRYEGNLVARDGAYHQGTAWPWLLGPFVDAWLRVRGRSPEAQGEARARFHAPLRAHLGVAGLGSVSEIADGDAPHTPRGCPFQAWSVGEMLRIEQMLERRT